ncbi:MAG: hypothetical protein M1816_004973 [Peltula sp. TS41687]|nr:MAG: hypothetical protein M1816_004973 [Peltula sp. TS41687]
MSLTTTTGTTNTSGHLAAGNMANSQLAGAPDDDDDGDGEEENNDKGAKVKIKSRNVLGGDNDSIKVR